MIDRNEMISTLQGLLFQYSDQPYIPTREKLFGINLGFTSGEIFDVLIHISKEYNINLNDYLNCIRDYSIDGLADAYETYCRIPGKS